MTNLRSKIARKNGELFRLAVEFF